MARHVLESMTKEELQLLDDSYKPDRFNALLGGEERPFMAFQS